MNTNMEKVLRILKERNISFRFQEHIPIYTIEEMLDLPMDGKEDVAKNLFLRDDKKRNYYLIVVREEKRVNLNELREKIQSRRLTFASEEDLDAIMGVIRGSVTPLGVLNDTQHIVQVYIDRSFEHKTIGCHPNTNEATVWMSTDNLVELIASRGNPVTFLDF